MILDTTPYFYPSKMHHSNDDPFSSIDTFSKFAADIPFVSKNYQEQNTMLFQFPITRKELLQLATQARIQGNIDNFKTENLLKCCVICLISIPYLR